MHQIQSPTSFAEAHGAFAPLQIHTRRGKCMFKHHTGSTGGCKSMPTTSRQQKVMPKAGLNRVMLTLHALAKTCWKLWRCFRNMACIQTPPGKHGEWYVDTHSLQFYFRKSNMYLLSLFAFMRKHTTYYLKKTEYTHLCICSLLLWPHRRPTDLLQAEGARKVRRLGDSLR